MKKKIKIIVALALLVLLLISGTFAWISIEQTRRSQADGGTFAAGKITLIDTYVAPERWERGKELDSTVYAQYPEVKNEEVYRPIAVRIQLSEYLESGVDLLTYSSDTYVTYTDEGVVAQALLTGVDPYAEIGGFVRFFATTSNTAEQNYINSYYGQYQNSSAADYFGQALDIFDEPKSEIDDSLPWYVKAPTVESSTLDEKVQIDGQYGKKIVTNRESADFTSLATGDIVNSNTKNDYANYTKFYTEELNGINESNISQKFRDYVDLGQEFTNSVILKDDYLHLSSDNKQTLKKWIYAVDEEGIPWFYWSQYLTPGQKTEPLLTTLRLKKDPIGRFLYLHNISMQAATADEFKNSEIIASGPWEVKPYLAEDDQN